jgi:formate dehydrogenase subunit gamma
MKTATHVWDPERARLTIQQFAEGPGALLLILHAFQQDFGYIDEGAIPMLVSALNISQADVHSAVSFYHDFRKSPPGHHVFKLCRAEACQSMGCDTIIRHVENRLGVRLGETSPNGEFTIDQIFCLGLCANSPAVMLDGKLYGRVTAQIIDSLIDSVLDSQ